jgi:nucleoside phosphorylase
MGTDRTLRRRPIALRLALACLVAMPAATLAGDALRIPDPLCAVQYEACSPTPAPLVAVFTAFPRETAPFIDRMQTSETLTIQRWRFDVGTLGGARIVVVRTGIGKKNARLAARIVAERFRPVAMVFSGVAGSYLNIGDVAVPVTWVERPSNATVQSDPALLAIAEQVAAAPPPFVQCGPVPPVAPTQTVCLQPPKLVVGGTGSTSDPYGENDFLCLPGSDDVFGCAPDPLAARGGAPRIARGAEPLAAVDMESASVARVADEFGIPFIAFRAVSDGAGDPLNLPGFPGQFFHYYAIAADNAAAATIAFLTRLSGGADVASPSVAADGAARLSAACDWPAALSARCISDVPSPKLSERVTAVCGLLAELPDVVDEAQAAKLRRHLRARWRAAAQLAKGNRQGLSAECRADVTKALGARSKKKPQP